MKRDTHIDDLLTAIRDNADVRNAFLTAPFDVIASFGVHAPHEDVERLRRLLLQPSVRSMVRRRIAEQGLGVIST